MERRVWPVEDVMVSRWHFIAPWGKVNVHTKQWLKQFGVA
jgi:hypothetical protein